MTLVPGYVREPVILRGVQDLVEPCVRVERQDVDVPVRRGEAGGMVQEGGVVVDDVLLVERRDGRADVVRGALEGREGDEEVRPAEVVVVRCLLLHNSLFNDSGKR